MAITQEELKKLLHYDPDTGVFTWISYSYNQHKHRVGKIAGSSEEKYIHMSIHSKRYYAHRLAWLYMTGEHTEYPKWQIDHINGNGHDNRFINLRYVHMLDNRKNLKIDSRNKSGITGVRWNKRDMHWVGQITINKNQIHLGCSLDLFEIACIRKSAEIKYCFHKNHGTYR